MISTHIVQHNRTHPFENVLAYHLVATPMSIDQIVAIDKQIKI